MTVASAVRNRQRRSGGEGRPSQTRRVIAILDRAGRDGLCSWAIYRGDEHGPLPNGRNVVSELNLGKRGAHGWKIEAVERAWPGEDDRPVHAHYFVRSRPDDVAARDQMRLW